MSTHGGNYCNKEDRPVFRYFGRASTALRLPTVQRTHPTPGLTILVRGIWDMGAIPRSRKEKVAAKKVAGLGALALGLIPIRDTRSNRRTMAKWHKCLVDPGPSPVAMIQVQTFVLEQSRGSPRTRHTVLGQWSKLHSTLCPLPMACRAPKQQAKTC